VTPEGRYIGIIQSAGIETDPYDPDGLVLTFAVQLPDGETVEPYHSTTGEYARITKQIVEFFGWNGPAESSRSAPSWAARWLSRSSASSARTARSTCARISPRRGRAKLRTPRRSSATLRSSRAMSWTTTTYRSETACARSLRRSAR